jgi:hypothetical protein
MLAWLIVIVPALAAEKPAVNRINRWLSPRNRGFRRSSNSICRLWRRKSNAIFHGGSPPLMNASTACVAACCSSKSMPIAISAAMLNARARSRFMAKAITCSAQWLSSAWSPVKAPTGSRLTSAAKRKPVRRSKGAARRLVTGAEFRGRLPLERGALSSCPRPRHPTRALCRAAHSRSARTRAHAGPRRRASARPSRQSARRLATSLRAD